MAGSSASGASGPMHRPRVMPSSMPRPRSTSAIWRASAPITVPCTASCRRLRCWADAAAPTTAIWRRSSRLAKRPNLQRDGAGATPRRSQCLAQRFVRDLGRRLLEARFEYGHDLFRRLHDIELELETLANEALLAHVVDEGKKRRPIIVDVADDDRLGVALELRPG